MKKFQKVCKKYLTSAIKAVIMATVKTNKTANEKTQTRRLKEKTL